MSRTIPRAYVTAAWNKNPVVAKEDAKKYCQELVKEGYLPLCPILAFDGIFSAHGMVLRPNENVIDKDFFPFFISSDYFLDSAIKLSVGSLSPTINWCDMKELEFELPDFN